MIIWQGVYADRYKKSQEWGCLYAGRTVAWSRCIWIFHLSEWQLKRTFFAKKPFQSIPKNSDIEQDADISNGTKVVLETTVDDAGYHRRLTRRQIMMTTFGAGIGTG